MDKEGNKYMLAEMTGFCKPRVNMKTTLNKKVVLRQIDGGAITNPDLPTSLSDVSAFSFVVINFGA